MGRNLADAAKDDDRIVLLAAEISGGYLLKTRVLLDASEINDPDGFPEYGEFLECAEVTQSGTEQDAVLLEAPTALAKAIVSAGIEAGDKFVVKNGGKTEGGRWDFDVTPWADSDHAE